MCVKIILNVIKFIKYIVESFGVVEGKGEKRGDQGEFSGNSVVQVVQVVVIEFQRLGGLNNIDFLQCWRLIV